MKDARKVIIIFLLIVIGLLVWFIFTPTNDNSYTETQVNENIETGQVTYKARGVEFHVVEIDGCEYIMGTRFYSDGEAGFMSHKGNCKYCEERRRAEQY